MANLKSLWATRESALLYLANEPPRKVELLLNLFVITDKCLEQFERLAVESENAQLYGVTTLKAKNLAIGTFGLILDGLAQEAGALIRPFIEYAELLPYMRQNPASIGDILSGKKLPSAGARAKTIESIYKDFRCYLNQHASHSAYSANSLAHLFEPETKKWKLAQPHVDHVLDRNLGDFAAQYYLFLREVLWCLHELSPQEFMKLGKVYDDMKVELFEQFRFNERAEKD